MVDSSLVVLYDKLRCPELVEPSKASAEIFQWVKKFNKLNSESLLLWLSIVRRIFCEYVSALCDLSQSNDIGSIGKEKLDWGFHMVNLLLQQQCFLSQVVECLKSEDQLVSYLASKVLSLTLQHPKCTTESCVPHLAPLLALSKHEPMYALQVMKSCIKRTTKSKVDSSDSSSPCLPITPALWHEFKTALVSRLCRQGSCKWPRLNFTTFLEVCSKLIPYQDFEPLIGNDLHQFIDLVNIHCRDLDTLRRVVKVSLRVVKKLQQSSSEVSGGEPAMTAAVSRAAGSLLESALLRDVVRGVVSEMSHNREGDVEWNLKKAVVRDLVVLVMNLATLRSDNETVVDLETMVSGFLHGCGLEPSDSTSVVRTMQHQVIQLMCDQDTALVDMLTVSIALWRKRNMLCQHYSLNCCFLYTRLPSILAEFLHMVCYDHSILLDFLISSETSKFVGFMQEFAETCVHDWAGVREAWDDSMPGGVVVGQLCRMESVGGGSQESESEIARGKHPVDFLDDDDDDDDDNDHDNDDDDDDDDVDKSATILETTATDLQPYRETTLDKIMNCFIQLKYSLIKLQAHKLLPFNAKLLLSTLEQMEDLYEN